MTVYILGGGPAGLAAFQGLIEETQEKIVLLEAAPTLGGLAQTLSWKDENGTLIGAHDLGPHKIFSIDPEVTARVRALLPEEEWRSCEKACRIFMSGQYLPYPPSPFSLGRVFGWPTFFGLSFSYALALLKGLLPHPPAESFKEDLERRVGKGLANALFYPIARKLWAPPETLDVKLSKGRIQTPSLLEILRKILNPSAKTNFETLSFAYPKGGLGKLWDAIAAKAGDRGTLRTNTRVTAFEMQGQRLIGLITKTSEGKETRIALDKNDFVLSTLPLALSARLLKETLGQTLVEEAQKAITLNDLILVFLHVDAKEVFPDSWLIVPDPDLPFHRLSEQKAFDPGMTPNGTLLCAELMGRPDNDVANALDEVLKTRVLEGLAKMGKKDLPVLHCRIIRLPASYPVYHKGFQPVLDALLCKMDFLENFRTLGRQGAFNYIGTLDAMDTGYGAASWLASGNLNAWPTERARTASYPVLD